MDQAPLPTVPVHQGGSCSLLFPHWEEPAREVADETPVTKTRCFEPREKWEAAVNQTTAAVFHAIELPSVAPQVHKVRHKGKGTEGSRGDWILQTKASPVRPREEATDLPLFMRQVRGN